MPLIELWSRYPPPESVGTAQLIDGAVTTAKIADGAVTSSKVSEGLRSEHILGDNTEVKTGSDTYEVVKTFNFYKDASVESLNWTSMEVVVEGKIDTPGATGYIAFFLDTEGTPRKEMTFTDTSYSVLRDTFDISDLSTGMHTLNLSMKVDRGKAYNRHLEIKFSKSVP